MPQSLTISSDLLADNKVKNCVGQDIGRIEELILQPETGAVSHAVISYGGFLGASDRLFVVPWSALELDRYSRTFHLNVDRQTLRSAPKFTRGQADHLAEDYLSHVDAHYSGCANSLACTAA